MEQNDLSDGLPRFLARDLSFSLGKRTLLMGVLNVTPDSFSDGGEFVGVDDALAHAQQMVLEGADIIDIGGESTRPGSVTISADEEIARVLPVLSAIRSEMDVPVSIDTYKSVVARQALDLGAAIVNDVWGFRRDPEMARVAADYGAGVVLMHNRHEADATIDIMREIIDFLSFSVDIALNAGIQKNRVALDPGIGFGKTFSQSAEAIRRLPELKALGFPVLLGASRKRFIGHLLGVDEPRDRLFGTLAAHLSGVIAGADIIRAHDIKAHRQALDVLAAVRSDR